MTRLAPTSMGVRSSSGFVRSSEPGLGRFARRIRLEQENQRVLELGRLEAERPAPTLVGDFPLLSIR